MQRRSQWQSILALLVLSLVAFSITIFTGDHSHVGEESILIGSFLGGVAAFWALGMILP